MESKLYKRKVLAIITILLALAIALSCVIFIFSNITNFIDNVARYTNTEVSNVGLSIEDNGEDKLSSFSNGASYVFTDKDKVDDFRAGTEQYDITAIVVDSSQTLGTQKNPYVIADIDEWEVFVKQMESDTTYGSGQYFVLGADLDFDGKIFRPVRFFNGTFYGLGHSIKNISVNGTTGWVYWNGNQYAQIPTSGSQSPYGYGLFCKTVNCIITDLIIENFNYSQMPDTAVFNSRNVASTGGIVGQSNGRDYFLNCHVVGEIKSDIAYAWYTPQGGIIGAHATRAVSYPLFVYRCSAEVIMDTETVAGRTVIHGGIIGDSYDTNSIITVYDCVANLDSTTSTGIHTSISIVDGVIGNQQIYIENVIGAVNTNSTIAAGSGALVGVYGGTTVSSVKNCYVEGQYGTTAKYAYAGIGGSQQITVNNTTVSNINVVKPTDMAYWSSYQGSYGIRLSGHKEFINSNLMLSEAKTFLANNYSQIWGVDKIGGSYDPDNSPVRNYLFAFINFRNLNNGGNSEEKVGIDDGNPYMEGDTLPSPSGSYVKANHVFKGWTTDKSGNEEPFTDLPSGIFGDVTLYAVWGLPDSYVENNVTVSLTSDVDILEYDSKTSITLTGLVTHKDGVSGGMLNPSVKYRFMQKDKLKATNTTGKLSLKTVADSGKYTYTYRITDGSEPLWFYDGECADSKTLTIEKSKQASMSIEDFQIDENTVPYYGKGINLVEFSVTLKNKAGIVVEQSAHKWELQNAASVVKGENKLNIVIEPLDKENYENQYIFEVKFESEALNMIFDMNYDINRELSVEVEYGQNYGSAEIIYLFKTVYMKALSSDDTAYTYVSNKAPYFALEVNEKGEPINAKPIVEETSSDEIFNESFDKISEEKRIYVTFKDASYEVTFNYNDKGATANKTETYSYGQFVKKPTPDPKYTDSEGVELLFVGWYFTETYIDESGAEQSRERAWRFNSEGEDKPQDRVTGKTLLTAKWLKANTLESISVEVNSSKKFIAQTQLAENDLIVTAVFSGTVDGITVSQPKTLNWSDFSSGIKYLSSADNRLHVTDGGYEIQVSYAFGNSQPKIVTAKINVLPIEIDTSKAKFQDKIVIYDGTDKDERIDPVTWSGARPSQIIDVKYVYTLDGMPIEEDALKGLGDYIVQAVFVMRSKDFYAEPLTATLSVRNATELKKPTFVGGVTYDGTEKQLEDYLDGFDSEYMEIVAGNGTSGKEVGRYTAYIKLKDGSWEDGSTDNIKIEWTIDKSTLVPDWDNWEFVLDGDKGFAPVISGIADGLAEGESVNYANDFTYKIYDEEGNLIDASQVSEVGSYKIVASINGDLGKNYLLDNVSKEWSFVVVPKSGMTILTVEWSDTQFIEDGEGHRPTYVVKDRNGDEVTDNEILSNLVFEGYAQKTKKGTYTIKVTVKDGDNYFIRSGAICIFKITDESGNAPDYDPEDPDHNTPSGNMPSGDGTVSGNNTGSGTLDEILKKLKEIPLWQLIASVVSIILILIFIAKTAGYENKRKKYNKKADKLDSTVYSVAPFMGIAVTGWTAIACALMGLAVASFVMMLIAKSRAGKAEENYEESLAEAERRRKDEDKENMRMMLMGMGGNGAQGTQGGYMGGGYSIQQGLGAEEIRGLISETVTALLPGVQQMLPQQASNNDEVVAKLIEQNAQNEERMRQMSQENEERIEKLMKQLAKQQQQSVEKAVTKEAASATISDEAIEKLASKLQPSLIDEQTLKVITQNNNGVDETIKRILDNQDKLIAQMLELSKDKTQPQIIEKEVIKEVPIEKIVEKEVKVEVPVEKIVEKEIIKEIPVEKVVEKEVVKEVKVPVVAAVTTKPKKEVAPRLTLDEAYALLSKQQQKYFDGLREYALTKDKCKEKRSTYAIVIGQSTVNPLIKLTIKKNMTVALFKMEDEYLKDIKRDATSDGTKVKVKETEVEISDAQACKTAKHMIDLREDQIERYQELLKEQKAIGKRK